MANEQLRAALNKRLADLRCRMTQAFTFEQHEQVSREYSELVAAWRVIIAASENK